MFMSNICLCCLWLYTRSAIWPGPFSIFTFYHHYPFQHFHRCNYMFLHNLQWRCQCCHLSLVHVFSVHMKNLLTRPQRSSQLSLPRLNFYIQIFFTISSSPSSSFSWRVRRVSLILKMKLVHPSIPLSSYVPSSFWLILYCLFWFSICIHPLYVFFFNYKKYFSMLSHWPHTLYRDWVE